MKRGCECFMPCVKDGWIDGSAHFFELIIHVATAHAHKSEIILNYNSIHIQREGVLRLERRRQHSLPSIPGDVN